MKDKLKKELGACEALDVLDAAISELGEEYIDRGLSNKDSANWDDFCYDLVDAVFDVMDDFPGSINCWSLVDGLSSCPRARLWFSSKIWKQWGDYSRARIVIDIAETISTAIQNRIHDGGGWATKVPLDFVTEVRMKIVDLVDGEGLTPEEHEIYFGNFSSAA